MRLSQVFKCFKEVWYLITYTGTVWNKTIRKVYTRGKSVEVTIPEASPNVLVVRITGKIHPESVSNGVLIPFAHEGVRKRGGKRFVEIPLSYETAELLYEALGPALLQTRVRIRIIRSMKRWCSFFDVWIRLKEMRTP